METEAINNQTNLVNYDNENEINDLGYQSEKYIEVAHEDDENNHSNGYAKRGITRLCKFRREYGKPGGVKLSVTFDALNKISGKHRALFSSFLGDMVREHIGLQILSWKKVGPEARNKLWDEITLVMNRLGQLLRNFRRKLRQTYILPNQDTPSKLNEVPAKYTAILKAEDWVNFVNYTATEEYKVKSTKAKMARSKCVFPHTMGRGGYAHVKEKMIEKKEIEQDEEPTRGTLWLKGRVNKDGEYQEDEIRSVGDKLKETEDKIKEGTLQVDQGTDSMTLVLGKEKGGYARGVGSEVTYKRYFDLPRSKQAADERILLLESQLDAARCEREEKELLIKCMSSKMSQTEGTVIELKNQLAAQGGHTDPIDSSTNDLVSPVEIHPINSSADEEGGTTVLGCDQNDASIQKEMQKRETVKSVGAKKMTRSIRKDSSSQDSQSKENVSVLPQAIKCRLWHLKKTTIIAEGTVNKSDGKIMFHNKALPNDFYKVSIDKSLVDAAFIPDVGSNGCTTVLDAVGGFVALPKNQVVLDPKATPPSTIQMITGENKTAPKVQTKRKNIYVSSDAMQKEDNKKRSRKALVIDGMIHYLLGYTISIRGLPSKVNKARVIMSYATSVVTYTSVYTDSEPGRTFLGADDEEPVAPPSPDYIPGLEDPQTPPVPQDEDEHKFLAEEQPLPPVDLPTTESPRYDTESDPEEDPEEYEDNETKDGPVDYPMDGGDNGDDDNGDLSWDDANEDEDDEDEEDEEEEGHIAPADSTIAVPVDEPIFPPKGTEHVIPPPSIDITIGARITVRPQTSISLPPEAEIERLLAMTTLLPSPPILLSPPSAGERLARIASTQALIDAVTAALPSPPLPPLPPSLYIPPPVDRRDDIPESEQPPRKRLYLSTLGSRYEVGKSSTARPTRGRGIDYGFVSTVDAEERRQGIRDVGVIELTEFHEHDTQDLYALLEDAQDRDSMDGGGGGLCFPRGLGSLDRIESGDSSGASDPSYMRLAFRCPAELARFERQIVGVRTQMDSQTARPETRIPDHQDASGDADSHI
ncbi:putative transposase, Ptta/En/Spm, plant [Tanacetum coccineum]|uniref:Transposase, Ptta/En/Spm, plant n=1 Tax=Tanacetum coccineum TaxID=301880 RepID=A0ABQ5E5W8_9ASTR